MQGGLGRQARLGCVVRVVYGGLGAGGASGRAARGAVLRGGLRVSNHLEENGQERVITDQNVSNNWPLRVGAETTRALIT